MNSLHPMVLAARRGREKSLSAGLTLSLSSLFHNNNKNKKLWYPKI